ncbi:cyclin [Geranomyces variabilis]|nr:cyclin [Geranomyces variabilis]
MELELHCNNIQCRKGLGSNARACVTTCSHIFCVECAEKAFNTALICPACESSLTDGDDIVFTELNPSEEYKSSVLAGLRPEVIIEIASRGLR